MTSALPSPSKIEGNDEDNYPLPAVSLPKSENLVGVWHKLDITNWGRYSAQGMGN